MWCYKQKRIDILKPKLPVTHPHPEEFEAHNHFCVSVGKDTLLFNISSFLKNLPTDLPLFHDVQCGFFLPMIFRQKFYYNLRL